MVNRPIQEQQIGDFYVLNSGGDSIIDSNINTDALSLFKINPNSNGSLLVFNNSGTGYDIISLTSPFKVSNIGDLYSRSATLNEFLSVKDLIVTNSVSFFQTFSFAHLNVSGNSNLNLLNVSGDSLFEGVVNVNDDLNLNANLNIDQNLIIKNNLTVSGNSFIGDTLTSDKITINTLLDVLGSSTFQDDILISAGSSTSPLKLTSNSSSDVNLTIENTKNIGSTGFASIRLQTNANLQSYPYIEFNRGLVSYFLRVSPLLNDFSFLADTASDFTTRFEHSTFKNHNVIISGNTTINKDLLVQGDFTVQGDTIFNTLNVIANSIQISGEAPDNLLMETKLSLSSGFSPDVSLRLVGSGIPYQLVFYNGTQSIILSHNSTYGLYDAIVPLQYSSPADAYNNGKRRILVLAGTYTDSIVNINDDEVIIYSPNKSETFWNFNQLVWIGNSGLIEGFTIGSGAEISIEGISNQLSNCEIINSTISFNEAINSKINNIIINEIETPVNIEKAIFTIEEGCENLEFRNINAKLNNVVSGISYFAKIESGFTNILFDNIEIENITTAFKISSGINSSLQLKGLTLQNIIASATNIFFDYDSLNSDSAPLTYLKVINCILATSDNTKSIFNIKRLNSASSWNDNWIFDNITTITSSNGEGTSYHYYFQPSLIRNVKFNNILAWGGYLIKLDARGQDFNFSNITLNGNTTLADATAKGIWVIDLIANQSDLAYITFTNINTHAKPHCLRCYANTANIYHIVYTGFNAVHTVNQTETSITPSNGGNFELRTNSSWLADRISVSTGVIRTNLLNGSGGTPAPVFSTTGTVTNTLGIINGVYAEGGNSNSPLAISIGPTDGWVDMSTNIRIV